MKFVLLYVTAILSFCVNASENAPVNQQPVIQHYFNYSSSEERGLYNQVTRTLYQNRKQEKIRIINHDPRKHVAAKRNLFDV